MTANLWLQQPPQGRTMKPGIESAVAHIDITVSDEMVARLDDRILHPVYSTFWLGYHAEVAARRAIEPYFDEGENACGTGLSLRHSAMAAIGAHVCIEARVTSVTGNRILCSIEASIAGTDICLATGTQEQAVLPTERLARLAETAHR
jgi:predicted thioesterase